MSAKLNRNIDKYSSPHITPEIGKRIMFARRKMDMGQPQLAALLGISRSMLSKIENGRVKQTHITMETFKAVFTHHMSYIINCADWQSYEYGIVLKSDGRGGYKCTAPASEQLVKNASKGKEGK